MADAITHITTVTPSGSTGSMLFTSIPQTYDDLLLIGTVKGQGAAWLPTNGSIYFGTGGSEWSSTGQYNYQQLYDQYSDSAFLGYQNNHTSAGTSNRINGWPMPGSLNDSNNPAGWWLYVPGYSNTTNSVGKSFQLFAGCISNSTNQRQLVNLAAGTMPNASGATNGAIDTLSIYCSNGNLTTSSKMSMYGITNS